MVAAATSEQYVTIHTPGSSPGVFDFPVVSAALSAISDDKDTVVQVVTAGSGEDSTTVKLEGGLVGFDGNRDGLLSNCTHQSVLILLRYISVVRDLDDLLAAGGLAASLRSLVWIRGFPAESSFVDDVFEGIVHETTVASLVSVASRAINQLLFRKADQVPVVDVVDAFYAASGRESPARTTLSLVFDLGDGSLLGPVDRTREIFRVGQQMFSGDLVDALGRSSEASNVAGTEFLSSQVSKLVDIHGPSVVSTVVLINLSQVRVVDGAAALHKAKQTITQSMSELLEFLKDQTELASRTSTDPKYSCFHP